MRAFRLFGGDSRSRRGYEAVLAVLCQAKLTHYATVVMVQANSVAISWFLIICFDANGSM